MSEDDDDNNNYDNNDDYNYDYDNNRHFRSSITPSTGLPGLPAEDIER